MLNIQYGYKSEGSTGMVPAARKRI